MNSNTIGSIGVIGAGLMGHSIAMNFAAGGHKVVLVDTTDENLRMAMENVSATLGVLQEQGLVDESTAQAVPGRIRTSTSVADAMDDVGFVVEAVFEDLDLKRRIFADLDRHCPPHAVLTSNTSSYMTSQLAPSTNRPDKVVVANWWNPAHLLPLVEVVRGPDTSDETIEITKSVLEGIGKRPVVLQKESLGFIGNRMQFALLREALAVVDKGIASAEDVDTVVKTGFGRRLAVAGTVGGVRHRRMGHHLAHHRRAVPRSRHERRELANDNRDAGTRRPRRQVGARILRMERRGGGGPAAADHPCPGRHRPL